MIKLTISLLGEVTIKLGGATISGFASRKVEALLIYLASHPRPHPRETLATLLWPNNTQNRALANLSVALTSLRKKLPEVVVADRHAIHFNTDIDWTLDTAIFQQTIESVQRDQQQRGKLGRLEAAQLVNAVEIYGGDFLAGFAVRGAPEFETWALMEQERLRLLLLNALTELIAFYQERGRYDQAIGYAQRLLAVDPLQEMIHRQLMALFVLNGQRPAALAQYERCVQILADELGVEPDHETIALYEQVAAGELTVETLSRQNSTPFAPELPSPQHNLAVSPTRFIGREVEIARIDKWLADPYGRLLTITGPGGIGKSRLAQEVAHKYIGQFADGVWLVSLLPLSRTEDVVSAIAQTMGVPLSGKKELRNQLLEQLHELELLLILDNLEHLLNDGTRDLIVQICQRAPALRLIATSRERLQLQAEELINLRGLEYPVIENGSKLSQSRLLEKTAGDYPAVQLVQDRVRRIRPGLTLPAADVTALCQLVGGLPLALELAATWVRILPMIEIVQEIKSGLDTLSTTLHDIPTRHRSIRAVITTSWRMLSPEQQQLFRRLAVFRGGFSREAAQHIVGATPEHLLRLVDRSFLRHDDDQRFRRHPLLLQFAQEQLAAHPSESAETHAAHAHYFADFVQVRANLLQGEQTMALLGDLADDWDNILGAWRWAIEQQQDAALDRLIVGIGLFLTERSRYIEGVTLFHESYTALQIECAQAPKLWQIRIRIQAQLGHFQHEVGDFWAAESNLAEASSLAEAAGLVTTHIESLRNLGEVLQDLGERDRARPYLEKALQLCRVNQADHQYQEMLVLNTLGKMEVFEGRYDEAGRLFAEALQLAKELGQTFRIASLYNNMAVIANAQGRYDEAIAQYRHARSGFEAQKYDRGIAATSLNIGIAFVAMERYDEAMIDIQNAHNAYERMGYRRGMVNSLSVMGTVARKQGQLENARRYYYDSLRLAQAVGVIWSALSTLADVAELDISLGKLERAARLLTLIVQHPAVESTTGTRAQALLEDLRAELRAETVQLLDTLNDEESLEEVIHALLDNAL